VKDLKSAFNVQSVYIAGYSDGQRDFQRQNSLSSWANSRAESYANGYGNYSYKSDAWYLVYNAYRQGYEAGWQDKSDNTGSSYRW